MIDNIKSMCYDTFMETIKENAELVSEKPARGGRRAGAGRPRLELHQERERAVTRSITLTAEEWELLRLHSKSRSYSKAVSAALDLALNPRSAPADWCHSPNIWAGPGPAPAGQQRLDKHGV